MKKALVFAVALIVALVLAECLYLGTRPKAAASGESAEAAAVPADAPLAFDADLVAAAEARMWRAYYGGNSERVGLELVTLMRTQFGLDSMQAAGIAMPLAEAAAKFQSATGNYEAAALAPLRTAYLRLAQASGRDFDPDTAARAELAWWVARRTPGDDSAENVGDLIAELYAILYGKSDPHLARAGRLRAEAAHLRDTGGAQEQIEQLLRESYRHLAAAVK